MSLESKQLVNLSKIYNEAVYGKSPEQIEASKRKKDDLAGAPLTVTNADKKANTPAWKNYKAGKKGYKAADHLNNESAEHRRNPEGTIKQRFKSKQTDPSKKGFTGIGDDIGEIMRQNAAMKKAAAKKTKKEEFVSEGPSDKSVARTKAWMDKKGEKGAPGLEAHKERMEDHKAKRGVKKEAFVSWRQDLKEIPDYDQIPVDAKKINAKVEEKNVKNKVKINPEFKEEVEIISEKEVKVKDTRRTVDAIRAYDKSKDASRDADWDTEHGEKEKGDIEKKYAKKERGEIDKDDPNWKKKKYHTGMHGESYEATKTKEVMGALKKRDLKKDVKKKIAADIVKKKGDTSKSDDRYSYEDKLWDEVAQNLTELGELGGVKFKVVPLDEAERSISDRLERKRKLYDKTTRKAMDDARNTGEASGHNRFRMSSINTEYEKLRDKHK